MSPICSKMANFLFSAFFGGNFCYHSNDKSRIIPEFYTLAITLNNYFKEISEKQLLFFSLIGGQNSRLMHIPLCPYTSF